jgi:hypothetical protein
VGTSDTSPDGTETPPLDEAWPSSSNPLPHVVHLPNLYHLQIDKIDHFFENIQVPKLRSLVTLYGGGEWSHQLEKISPMASQLERLEVHHSTLVQPVTRGCPVPLLDLVELTINKVPSPSSSPCLLLAPNLKSLEIFHREERDPAHCLGYMLSPDGMLGLVHGLTRLLLQGIVLASKSQTDYCTRHLRLHRYLESLTFEACHLPEDFLALILRPLGTTDDFLPDLKELRIEECKNGPSEEWFAELATSRPLLVCHMKCR